MKTLFRKSCLALGFFAVAGLGFAASSSTTTGVHVTVASTCTLFDGDDGGTLYTTRVLDFGDYSNSGVATASTTASADYNATTYSGGSMGGAALPTNSGGGTVTQAVVVACSIGTAFNVGVDYGKQPSVTQRRMAHAVSGVSDTINYNIACSAVTDATATSALSSLTATLTALGAPTTFSTTNCSSLWGTIADTANFAGVGVGESVQIPVPIVASIPASQGNKAAGAYGDIVTVTVEF